MPKKGREYDVKFHFTTNAAFIPPAFHLCSPAKTDLF